MDKGLYWDNGKETGNYFSILGCYKDNGKERGQYKNLIRYILGFRVVRFRDLGLGSKGLKDLLGALGVLGFEDLGGCWQVRENSNRESHGKEVDNDMEAGVLRGYIGINGLELSHHNMDMLTKKVSSSG